MIVIILIIRKPRVWEWNLYYTVIINTKAERSALWIQGTFLKQKFTVLSIYNLILGGSYNTNWCNLANHLTNRLLQTFTPRRASLGCLVLHLGQCQGKRVTIYNRDCSHCTCLDIAGRGEEEHPETEWVEPTEDFHGKPWDWQIPSTAHPQLLSSPLSTSYPFLSLFSHHLFPIISAEL